LASKHQEVPCFHLEANQIKEIGEQLLAIPHIRPIRVASTGLAILPMKIAGNDPPCTI
jgi:L-lysine 2,3-aminomutase